MAVKRSERKFKDGETIFREGETSDAAYVVVDGTVDLVKAGERKPVRLATLEAGDLFGEMGVIDHGPRNATAVAVGPVTVKVIEREDFVRSVQDKPDMALDVMSMLVRRLRAADEMVAFGRAAKSSSGGGGTSAMAVFFKRLIGERTIKSERIEVRVAMLAGEDAEKQSRRIVEAFQRFKGTNARLLDRPFEAESDDGGPLSSASQAAARKWLADTDGDLLIWGSIPPPSTIMMLRLLPAAVDDDELGGFSAPAKLALPVEFDDGMAALLRVVALVAAAPTASDKVQMVRQILPESLESAIPAMESLPRDMTSRERAAVQMAFGTVVARLAAYRGAADFHQMAAQAFRAAGEMLARDKGSSDLPLARFKLGAQLHAMAERSNDLATFGAAADALREAIRLLPRAAYPREWAAAHNRLGLALYRLAFDAGDTESLKHSLGAFQSALQVYTKADHPLRWAEVMNSFAQVAQVLGEQLRNSEVLEKAVEACRNALEVRKKETMPALWAATQNNLGSALFLLGRMKGTREELENALAAFATARDVYTQRGAERMAAIAERNLARVEQILDGMKPKAPARKGWHEIEDDDLTDVPDAASEQSPRGN